jgi:hypothetical protein
VARSTGIVGFETGVLDGSWMTEGGNITLVDNGTARTGRFFCRTSGAGFGNFQVEVKAGAFPPITVGESGDIRYRAFFRCAAYPASGDRNIAGITGGNSQHSTGFFEMNSTGHIRLNVSGAGVTAYGAQLALNRWYQIQIRIHGTILLPAPNDPNASVIHEGQVYEEDGTLVEDLSLTRIAYLNSIWLTASSNCVFGPFEFGAPDRDWHYDDIFYDFTTHEDADLSRPWPRHTHIEPHPILSQGALDDFTPAGAFDRVQEIPWVQSGVGDLFVTTPTLGASTSYIKAGVIDITDECEYARLYAYCFGSGSTQAMLWNDEELPVVTGTGAPGNPIPNNIDTRRSYLFPTSPLSGVAFNAAEYGLRKTSPAGATLDLHAQILEALIGPRIPPPPAEGCSDNLSNDLGGVGTPSCATDFPIDSDPVV